MHLKQLEVFVSVVRLRSFSKAAEAVYLSQPTVSAHISALEDELGAKLIVRSTKEVYPSKAGKIFYQYALEMLNLRDTAMQEVKSLSTQVKGTLDVAASSVPSQYLLPKVMPGILEKYPQLTLSIKQYDSVEVVHKIIGLDAEIGVTGATFDKSGCVFEPIAEDRLVIITPNTPEFAALNGKITPEVIASSRYVTRELGSGTRKESEDFLRSIGIDPQDLRVSVMLESTESVIQAVKNNLGIAIVSKYACEDCVASGGILVFDYESPDLDRSFYVVYRKNRPLSPSARAFIKEIKSTFAQ
ncbi:MAG: LysR family transcriptional regulator [Clostridia bacterium]|nr:LysR family transcriptional regulator [Clostridia bacterium]MBQ9966709.1 LysR family transcriptional regulator [Clostridia bacterium]